MIKIILDTNFLLIPAQQKVDIFSEIERICNFRHEVIILDKSIDELNKIIAEQAGKAKKAAKIGLQLIKAKKIAVYPTDIPGSVDDIIVELVKKGDFIPATQDRALVKRVKAEKGRAITLRQMRYLIFS
jgi:uncharacterized protein